MERVPKDDRAAPGGKADAENASSRRKYTREQAITPTAGPPDAPSDGDPVEPDAVEGEILDVEVGFEEVEVTVLQGVVVADGGETATAEVDGAFIPLPRGGGTLVRHDPLSRYLAEINRFDRLSAQEEHDLALRYREMGDHDAAARLVTSNLRLVVAVAMSFRRAIANMVDLIQEGNIGLMEAVERFDPDKGTRLSTYATWWIRSRIVKYLLDNWRLVRVGTTNARRKLLYNLRREKERMEAMGIQPTPKLLAERLGTTAEDVIAVDRALGASDVSLDAPIGEDGKSTRGDLLADTAFNDPEQEACARQFRAKLNEVLASFAQGLSPREKALLHQRLLSEEPCTLQEIAEREGVTREAVRQSEKRLTLRLRTYLEEHLPEAAEVRFEGR